MERAPISSPRMQFSTRACSSCYLDFCIRLSSTIFKAKVIIKSGKFQIPRKVICTNTSNSLLSFPNAAWQVTPHGSSKRENVLDDFACFLALITKAIAVSDILSFIIFSLNYKLPPSKLPLKVLAECTQYKTVAHGEQQLRIAFYREVLQRFTQLLDTCQHFTYLFVFRLKYF